MKSRSFKFYWYKSYDFFANTIISIYKSYFFFFFFNKSYYYQIKLKLLNILNKDQIELKLSSILNKDQIKLELLNNDLVLIYSKWIIKALRSS